MFNFSKNKKDDDGAVLVFDIGGTKMRLAVSRDGKTFDEPKIVSTPENFEEAMIEFKKLADDVRGGLSVKSLCGGIPGVLNRDGATIFRLPNLPEWDGKPLKAELERMFNAPAYLENDSALVGLGEAVVGAGKGYNIVAYMTVSTGVGGARIVGGKIDEKVFNFEPGWQKIGAIGDRALGGYISGASVEERFGKSPRDITDQAVLDELASWLALGLYNSILHWSPEVFVLGGSMITGINPIPIDKTESKLKELLIKAFPETPIIKKAELGDFGGLYGALELARQKIIS